VEVAELVRRQRVLQHEAASVRKQLRLDEHLAGHGEIVAVGSAALGLMVWRDLDLTVICPALDVAAVAMTGAHIAADQRVREVTFRNDTGRWNTDPRYPDGLYLGVQCRSADDETWKIDIWFVDQPDRQPDLAHLRELPERLTEDARAAILTIKDAWAVRPEYGRQVTSWDIYTAVLDHDVRTPKDFDEWLRKAKWPR